MDFRPFHTGGQFLEWQSLMGTADASDVSVLALGDGEVAIVIALKVWKLFRHPNS